MAKLDWPTSVLALRLTEKQEREAVKIPLETRDYLHSVKHSRYQALMELDPASNDTKVLVQFAGLHAQIRLLEELLLFFNPQDLEPESTD